MLISSARSATYLEYLVYFITSTQQSVVSQQSAISKNRFAHFRGDSWPNSLSAFICENPRQSSFSPPELIVRPSIPHRRRLIIAALKWTFMSLRLFFRAKDAFFCPSNSAVRVQAFQHKLRRGYQHLRLVL